MTTPRTAAGRALDDLAPKLWEQPEDPSAPYDDPRSHSQARQIEVRQAILAIEAEARADVEADIRSLEERMAGYMLDARQARAAALDEARAAVETSFGDDSDCLSEALAAIDALRERRGG